MELRVLRYFLTIANERSISKAAEILHVTQPTLSRQIIDLEDELDTKLLIRSKQNRNLTLTEDGIRLYDYATQIVDLSVKAKNSFLDTNGQVEGDIYIGAGESNAMKIVAKAALIVHQEHPKIRFHFFSGNAELISARMDKGLIDFGIFIGLWNMERYDYTKLNVCDSWGLLTRKDNPLAQKTEITSKDLENEPIFMSYQALNANILSPWFGSDFHKMNLIGTYNLVYNATIMAEEGLGSVLMLDKLANTSSESNLCFRPLKPKFTQELYISWRKGIHLSKPADLFLKTLKKLIQELNEKNLQN